MSGRQNIQSKTAYESPPQHFGACATALLNSNTARSVHFGSLQALVEKVFEGKSKEESVRRVDVIIAAEMSDLCPDLLELVNLLPPGNFRRQQLCDQLNSSIAGHAWGQVYGTVE